MKFKPIDFLNTYGIHWTNEGSDSSPGFVNISCPFCGDEKEHGGFSLHNNYYNCWRCGFHPIEEVIQNLVGVDYWESKKIIKEFSGAYSSVPFSQLEKKALAKSVELPKNAKNLSFRHRRYLERRRFDPDYLIKKYDIKGTNHIGNYSHRIIIPIYFQRKLISFQGRDITNRAKLRYKVCAKKNEVIHHKHILYNIDRANKDRVLVVEGVFDVWRLGSNCVATFGTSILKQQIYLLSKFNKVFFLMDEDAEEIAEKIGYELSGLNTKVEVIKLNGVGDPSDLSFMEAQQLKKELKI